MSGPAEEIDDIALLEESLCTANMPTEEEDVPLECQLDSLLGVHKEPKDELKPTAEGSEGKVQGKPRQEEEAKRSFLPPPLGND